MSTKTKTLNGFSALQMDPNGVVIGVSNATPTPESASEVTAKAASPKKSKKKPQTSESGVKVETFSEVVSNLEKRERELAEREARMAEIEARFKQKEELLDRGIDEILRANLEKHNKTSERKETMAEEKKEETTAVAAAPASHEEAVKLMQSQLEEMRLKVETEDTWTRAKKGFAEGAGVAAGVAGVYGLIKLGCYIFGGND